MPDIYFYDANFLNSSVLQHYRSFGVCQALAILRLKLKILNELFEILLKK